MRVAAVLDISASSDDIRRMATGDEMTGSEA